MPDLSECPSCGVKPNVLKICGPGNAWMQFRHLATCEIGHAERIYPIGGLVNPSPEHRYRCPKCSAEFTLSDETPISYVDGGGTSSRECPICWATAEASRARGSPR